VADGDHATGEGASETAMKRVDIYTSPFCPYCHRAKALLNKRGIPFNEIDVLMHPDRRREMERRAGGAHTVPQIFFGDRHVGGCDQLVALDQTGELLDLARTLEAGAS
jgi:glutaredoxin 3